MTSPLRIKIAGKLPLGTELIASAQGIDRIQALAAVNELDPLAIEVEIELFASYALAHLGDDAFVYSQIFATPGECIALLFLCGPKLRDEIMLVFRTRTVTDADIDHHMALMESIVEKTGIAHYRKLSGDPNASVHVITDFEIQAPYLLARAKN
jgi:hypothetical protein